jgi:hypothetical protein
VEEKPAYHWYHFTLQVIFASLYLHWRFNLPAPNKAVLAMAAMVALMMLADMRPFHKAVYFALVIAFFTLENHAIDKERMDAKVKSDNDAKLEETTRQNENEKFDTIAGNLTAANKLSQAQFSATISRIESVTKTQTEIAAATKEVLDETTGGDSFPEVLAELLGNGELRFSITSIGKHNVTDLRINIMSHMQRKDLDYITQQTVDPLAISIPIAPAHAVIGIPIPVKVIMEGDLDAYQVNVSARNGTFLEMLEVKKGGPRGWHEDMEIYDMHGSKLLVKTPGFGSN